MNLQELLEELRENILRDVDDSVDADPDNRLHSDRTLVRYINDGEIKFASQTLCLRDETTPELTRIKLVAGQTSYPLDPRVKAVLGARIGNRNLGRTTYAALTTQRGDIAASSAVLSATSTTCPLRFYTDRETGMLGVWPAPGTNLEGEEMALRVARLPLKPLVATKLGAVPEVPEEFHLDILEWAAWRALRNHDTDVENMAKASAHKKRFNDAVEELARESKRLLVQDIQFGVNSNWS